MKLEEIELIGGPEDGRMMKAPADAAWLHLMCPQTIEQAVNIGPFDPVKDKPKHYLYRRSVAEPFRFFYQGLE